MLLISLLISTALLFPSLDGHSGTDAVPTIRGKLVGSDGKVVQYTELELVSLDLDRVPNDSRFIGVSDTQGRFAFNDVPAGKYTLSINFGEKPTFLSPFSTVFYPEGSERASARIFEIEATTRISGLVFKLPASLKKKTIVGKITWPDGRPVVGAMIGCKDLEFDVTSLFGGVRSDKNGRFSFEAFVGRQYQIGLVLFDRDIPSPMDLPFDQVIGIGESPVFVLSADQPLIEVKLILTRDAQKMIDKYVG